MTDRFAGSRLQHQRARNSLAGGIATAFRAAQQPVPISFERGVGAYLWDIDGNRYADYALAFGPMLLGHSPTAVLDAVRHQLTLGLGYGASHPLEAELAEAVCRLVPSAELCIFNSTGSEAVHAAVRIARAATGRVRVIKFQGHYHGWLDPLHLGLAGRADPDPGTGGQDPLASANVTVCRWNDPDALRAELRDDVAAVIMEPVNVNAGCLQPAPGYLEAVRELTAAAGTVLIFDEVITGFRLSLGGAQAYYGVRPDLTVLGKALGGGFPISAVCGSRAAMEPLLSSRVAHVGTFNLNPVCASAALAALTELERRADEIYPRLADLTGRLAEAMMAEGAAAGLPLVVNNVPGAAHAFIGEGPIATHEDTLRADAAAYRRFAGALLAEGVHVIPRGLLYVSSEHTEADLQATYEAVQRAAVAFATAARS